MHINGCRINWVNKSIWIDDRLPIWVYNSTYDLRTGYDEDRTKRFRELGRQKHTEAILAVRWHGAVIDVLVWLRSLPREKQPLGGTPLPRYSTGDLWTFQITRLLIFKNAKVVLQFLGAVLVVKTCLGERSCVYGGSFFGQNQETSGITYDRVHFMENWYRSSNTQIITGKSTWLLPQIT